MPAWQSAIVPQCHHGSSPAHESRPAYCNRLQRAYYGHRVTRRSQNSPARSSLGGLLGHSGTACVSAQISSRVELPGTALDTVPHLSGSWRRALRTNEVVDPGLEPCEGALDVGALAETSAQEDGVDDQQDPAPTLEEDGREQQAEPQSNLEAGDNGHGRVVVLLDEGADGISEWVRGHMRSRTAGGTGGGNGLVGGSERRDDGGASVGREMKYGVDEVRQQSDWVLWGEEPDEGQN